MSEKNITIVEIISMLDCAQTAILDPQEEITGFNSIHESKKHEVTFCSYKGDAGAEMVRASGASLIICHQSLYGALDTKSNVVFVKNPRLTFINCIRKFFPKDEIPAEIHTTAVIESKRIGKNVHIGPHSHIYKNAVIGENSIIHNNVVIYDNVRIGKNVIIGPNTVVGKDGFGFERDEHGVLVRFPHVGGVCIHDHVEIGGNVGVDRGTIHDTVIGWGCKIDNLVQVGHNVRLGKNSSVVAGSVLGGGCVIGENVIIAHTVMLRAGIKIGSNSLIGMGSVVTRDIPEHVVVYGSPAKIIRDYP